MRMRAQTAIIENGKVWLPSDAPWLDDYLHELAMFPNGKYADQVDSTSQALKFIGEPDTTISEFMQGVREENLRKYGVSSAQLTVCFDHPEPRGEFTMPSGREVWRREDGYFWVTETEWTDYVCRAMGVVKLE